MSIRPNRPDQLIVLRQRAQATLGRNAGAHGVSAGPVEALGVLLDMASSPTTAANALAVLHELQVHQVELGLQFEELQSTLMALESALARQLQLYDNAPVAQFTVDDRLCVVQANLTGARWLGIRREALPGISLGSFMNPPSADALNRLLQSARLTPSSSPGAVATASLVLTSGVRREVHASLGLDQVDGQYLVVLMDSHCEPDLAA
jgi:PAS domain-containing protein